MLCSFSGALYCSRPSPPNELPLFPLWAVMRQVIDLSFFEFTGEEEQNWVTRPARSLAHRWPEVTWAVGSVARQRAEMLAGLLTHRPTRLCEAPAARRFSMHKNRLANSSSDSRKKSETIAPNAFWSPPIVQTGGLSNTICISRSGI
jgi:hypothetical protein